MDELSLFFLLISFFGVASFSAFFSGVEVAYLSLDRTEINHLKRKRIFYFLIKRYLNKIDIFLICVLLLNLFCNIIATLLAKTIVQRIGGFYIPGFSLENHFLSVAFIVLFAFGFIVFCELFPKRFCLHYSQSIVLIAALPMSVFFYVF